MTTSKKKKFKTYLILMIVILLLVVFFGWIGGGGSDNQEQQPQQIDATIPLKLLVDTFNRYNGLANTIESQITQNLKQVEEIKNGTITITKPVIPSKWGKVPVKIVSAITEVGNSDNADISSFITRDSDKVKKQIFIYYSYWNTDYASSFGYSLWYILSPQELHILREILMSKADGVWGYTNSMPLIKKDVKPVLGIIYRRSLYFPIVKTANGKEQILPADEPITATMNVVGFNHRVEQGVYIYDEKAKSWYAFPYKEVQRRIYATSLLPQDMIEELINHK